MKKKIVTIITAMVMIFASAVTVFATETAGNEVISALNKFDDIIFGIVRAIGFGFAAVGLMNLASSVSSHDSGQRMMGFSNIASALIAIFAKQIINGIGVA